MITQKPKVGDILRYSFPMYKEFVGRVIEVEGNEIVYTKGKQIESEDWRALKTNQDLELDITH